MANHPFGEWYSFFKSKYNEWHIGVPTGQSKYALFPDGIPNLSPDDTDRREELCNLIVDAVNAFASLKTENERLTAERNQLGEIYTIVKQQIEFFNERTLQTKRHLERIIAGRRKAYTALEKAHIKCKQENAELNTQLLAARAIIVEMCAYLDPKTEGQINAIKSTSQFHEAIKQFLEGGQS